MAQQLLHDLQVDAPLLEPLRRPVAQGMDGAGDLDPRTGAGVPEMFVLLAVPARPRPSGLAALGGDVGERADGRRRATGD